MGIRQKIDKQPDVKGKTLSIFADDPVFAQYHYSALATDMDLPATELWRLYRSRTDSENRIKELKYDFGGESFNLRDFWTTEAALMTEILTYNLMSLFRQAVLRSDAVSGRPDVQHTLKILHYKLFAKAGYIIHEGREKIITGRGHTTT
ncbi:transposase [Nitrosomonas sp. Nm33]|uniref:transposase n=1 Tax=Nitrosomonas sp. Nm33 TaxID=133724 RepID=UPI0008968685|nr:transposase [Nitrosomonas sp. Nm33]SDZ06302.1 Transposase DDE domain group 1 [Nitrosomonas sp. Nm33]